VLYAVVVDIIFKKTAADNIVFIERDVWGLDQELVSFDLFEPEGSGDQLLVGGG